MRYAIHTLVSFFCLLGVARAGDTCAEYSVRVVTDPVPMQYRDAFARWDRVKETLNPKADIIFLGDSLVENWSDPKMGIAAGGASFQNLGVSRDHIQNTLWRLNDIRLGQFSPTRVVILLGANNLGEENPDACAIAAGLKKTVKVAQKAWPKAVVYLIQVLPRGPDYHFRENVRKGVNSEMSTWKRKNYKFISVNESKLTCGLSDRKEDKSRNACSPSLICSNFKPDNLHLADHGYDILNEALKAAF